MTVIYLIDPQGGFTVGRHRDRRNWLRLNSATTKRKEVRQCKATGPNSGDAASTT